MNLNEACKAIADRFELDAIELINYAKADTIGGWDVLQGIPGQTTRYGTPLYEVGSVWEVEGQVLYALARVSKAKYALNIGHHTGCSAAHISQALLDNDNGGGMFSMDICSNPKSLPSNVKYVQSDVFDYKFPASPKFDFIFEDMLHTREVIHHVWKQAMRKAKKGAFIISHDSEHYLIGERVRNALDELVGGEYLSIQIEPAQCGLAIWRKP